MARQIQRGLHYVPLDMDSWRLSFGSSGETLMKYEVEQRRDGWSLIVYPISPYKHNRWVVVEYDNEPSNLQLQADLRLIKRVFTIFRQSIVDSLNEQILDLENIKWEKVK